MPSPPKKPTNRLLAWLNRRGENQKHNLQLLIIGAGVFFFGTGLIIWVDRTMPSSIEQEMIALVGSILCVIGILTALLGYLGLSLFRLIKFFHNDD